jgi:glucose-6-phosphate isomerase
MNSPTHAAPFACDLRAWHRGLHADTQSRYTQLTDQHADACARYHALLTQQPLFSSYDDAQHALVAEQVKKMRARADHLVVIGTGGASLAAQAFCALAEDSHCVSFLENCDARSMAQQLARLQPTRTVWLIVSKSGSTTETLAAALALEYWASAHVPDWASRVWVITSEGARPLRQWAAQHGITTLAHPTDLGGRFCAFSLVGLLPAAFAGLDVQALARAASAPIDMQMLSATARQFAASIPAQPIHVVMGYADRLRPFTQWYKQLWAESLGKESRGPTPLTAIGAIDQHSQLQLYLDGPPDKLFTLILPDSAFEPEVPFAPSPIAELAYLDGHHMAAVMRETAEATCATLAAHGVPMRVYRGKLTAHHVAWLMAQYIHETIMVAAYLQLDPFSQPAVETGKIRTREALAS